VTAQDATRARCGEPRRRRGAAVRRDEGSAVVEFVVLGVLLLVPVVYLVVTLGRLQAASFAADGGARAAGRAFVTAADEADGAQRAAAAVRLALLDHGFPASDDALRLECSARPCLTPDATVAARVSVEVVLPGVPEALDAVLPTHVTVRSTHVAAVDAFRAAAP
jgi:hypothetical protein